MAARALAAGGGGRAVGELGVGSEGSLHGWSGR